MLSLYFWLYSRKQKEKYFFFLALSHLARTPSNTICFLFYPPCMCCMRGGTLFILYIPAFSQDQNVTENMLRNQVLKKALTLHQILIFSTKEKDILDFFFFFFFSQIAHFLSCPAWGTWKICKLFIRGSHKLNLLLQESPLPAMVKFSLLVFISQSVNQQHHLIWGWKLSVSWKLI